jgi:hypothetical protein
MLTKPAYIDRARIAVPEIRFAWDEWNVARYYQPPDNRLVARTQLLSRRANNALTIAIAEWILYRFERLSADPEPWQYIEASWAMNVDLRYGDYYEPVDDEWRGPVRGPMSMAVTFVIDALFAEEAYPNAALEPAWATRFAFHVLPTTNAFRSWLVTCLQRLEQYSPAPPEADADWFDEMKNWGPLTPRELFDPDFVYDPTQAPALTGQFLRTLDWQTNEFLRSPQDMLAAGFTGTPYQI